MLYKSLHFKLVLVFVLFIICIIAIVGGIMLDGVFNFYTNSFTNQVEETLSEIYGDLLSKMKNIDDEDYYVSLKDVLRVNSGKLGINKYRHFYILDISGKYLAGSDEELGINLIKTQNILSAMNGSEGKKHIFGANYMDYARLMTYEDRECIIYIKDTQEEMRRLLWMMVSIIIQALLVGLIFAIALSFFLANAITAPIQNITKGALKLAEGDFKKIEVTSNDEIGTLADTFNDMARDLQNTLDDVSGEREKLQTIFLYLKDGVLVFSPDEMLLMINSQGNEILKEDFTYDNDFTDFLNLFNIKIDSEKDMEKLHAKESGGLFFRDMAYADNVFDVNIGKFKYKQEQSDFEGIIVVLHNITQQYALEKSRREFIANVSHELKTPLTSIRGAAETIQNFPQMKDKFLNMIISECDRMDKIVQDLLLVSRLDNKKMMWNFSVVKPDLLAQNIYDAMCIVAEKKNHTFTLNIGKNIPEINADKERIEQVLGNIISNAVKYTKDGGKINFEVVEYSAKKQGAELSGVKFIVSDTGYGIPKEDLPYVFERFYRVEKSRSTETGSTGLGLAIANEMVLAHGGQINIESKINVGTTVTIILLKDHNDVSGNNNKGDDINFDGENIDEENQIEYN